MRSFYIIMFLVFLTNCGGQINLPTKNVTENMFSLMYHKQTGTCESLPIQHRVLLFSYIPLEKQNDDLFVGQLHILLDDTTGTYKADYREYPGSANIDQTFFQKELTGRFEVSSSNQILKKQLVLEDLGVLSLTMTNNSLSVSITFDGNINKAFVGKEILGAVRFIETPLVPNNCLP